MSANAANEIEVGHEDYITKEELSHRLGKPMRTISYWMWRGWLPYYKVGRAVYFKWSEVERKLGKTFHHD
jgi:hypothetical protein